MTMANMRNLIRCIALSIFFLLVTLIYLAWKLPDVPVGPPKHPLPKFRGSSSHRIAILLPFVGDGPQSIPSYMNVFCMGAAGSREIVDFLIIHNGVFDTYDTASECPDNVKFISLSTTTALATLMAKVLDHKSDDELAVEFSHMIRLLAKHLQIYPYVLVEFKPALGFIFADYLKDYTHWGYADLDMIFGDLPRWITEEELTEYDIVTYGFGDQQRLYVRGQFTFHKNTKRINELWKSCTYLADIDERFHDILSEEAKYQFESAEGCYSKAILRKHDIKVKYAVKAWTDIDEDDTAYSHGVYLSRSHRTGRHVIYKAKTPKDGRAVARLPALWFEKNDRVYMDRDQPLQTNAGGAMEPIDLPKDPQSNCMYWVRRKYQSRLCLSTNVTSEETLYWVNGKLYRQRHETKPLDHDGVLTAPFFHFQEWKRYYRPAQLASLHFSSEVSTFVLSKEGAIPLYHKDNTSSSYIPSPLGLQPKRWKALKNDKRGQLPNTEYCLTSGPRKFPPNPPASQCYQSVSWRDPSKVEILSPAPHWKSLDVELDVTLTMTLQITVSQSKNREALSDILEIVVENLERWQGQPCVVVIDVANATPEVKKFLQHRFGPKSDLSIGIENSLIAAIFREQKDTISRKALLNMAIDAVPTRWHINGVELERGLSISPDALFFAHRVAKTHQYMQGCIFLLPQFALADAERTGLTLQELAAARRERQVKTPFEFEDPCDEKPSERVGNPDAIWWKETHLLIDPNKRHLADEAIRQKAKSLEELERAITELLTSEHNLNMYTKDESPILLIDNKGPLDGMRTNEIAREVEEFAGRRCYNGLRLAQLAAMGFHFDVLSGAFAASTEMSRKAMSWGNDGTLPGTSRCDGCFLFGDEHEDILEDIATDEIARPAKAAVLWTETV